MNTDPNPQMGHVKDGEVRRYGMCYHAGRHIFAEVDDGEYVTLAAYNEARAELAAARARARTDSELNFLEQSMIFFGHDAADMEEASADLHAILSLYELVKAERAALTSLEGGQNPDSRQAGSST